MRKIKLPEEANVCTAVRLTEKRQRAKVGDVFRLCPYQDVFLWGRFIKRDNFFGETFPMNLVYIYDAISSEQPNDSLLNPNNLIIGPTIVNNLGWSRGYWEIHSWHSISPHDVQQRHLFVRYRGTRGMRPLDDYDIVDEQGFKVSNANVDPSKLGQSGFSNYNHIDWLIHSILEDRGILPKEE